MTADEAREQKAMLLLDSQEAEQELAALEEKVTRVSERILAVGQWLDDAGRRNYDLNRSEVHLRDTGKKIDVLKDQQVRQAMNFDDAVKLIDEIKVARARVEDLHKRKQALGLK